MKNTSINYKKKMARLRYKDEIYELYLNKFSVDEITKKINSKLSRTNLKVNLSRSTIYNIIKDNEK